MDGSARQPLRIYRRRWVRCCAMILLTISQLSTVVADELPNLGEPALQNLSSRELDDLARNFKRHMLKSPRVIRDPVVQDYLDSLGHALARHSDNPRGHFEFFVIRSPDINAFAGPGGFIGVNSGLITFARNESELAAVLAHEIAHLNQDHLLHNLAFAKRMRIPTLAATLASLALGALNPELAMGSLVLGQAGFAQQSLNFSRLHESEADRLGMQTLVRSHFNPQGMADFFAHMRDNERYYYFSDRLPSLLRTHPVSHERIADAKNRATLLPVSSVRENPQFGYVKTRLTVMQQGNPQAAITHFGYLCQQQPQNRYYQYGLALSYLANEQPARAQHILQRLVKQYPDELVLELALSEAERGVKKTAQGLQRLQKLLALYPDHLPLLQHYGQALIQENRPQQAIPALQQAIYLAPHDPYLHDVLALAKARAGCTAAAYLERAKALSLLGDHRYAAQMLKNALAATPIDKATRWQILALQQTLKQQKSSY